MLTLPKAKLHRASCSRLVLSSYPLAATQQQPSDREQQQHAESNGVAADNTVDASCDEHLIVGQSRPAVAVPLEAFPWESLFDDISRLVHKGHDARWLARPSEVIAVTLVCYA